MAVEKGTAPFKNSLTGSYKVKCTTAMCLTNPTTRYPEEMKTHVHSMTCTWMSQ